MKIRKILSEYSDYLTKEWNYSKNSLITPKDVSVSSSLKVWWICDKGHEWQSAIKTRYHDKSGCPYCQRKRPIIGETDLFTTNPELKSEWDYEKNIDYAPEQLMAGSNKKVFWHCMKCGYKWYAQINSRSNGRGCPACAHKKLIPGINDLATQFFDICTEWDSKLNVNLRPSDFMPSSQEKVFWRCVNGHSWHATIHSRVYGHTKCPYCMNTKSITGVNDLATRNPLLAREWDFELNGNLKPDLVSLFSNKKVYWKCSKGHSWKATISHRQQGSNCPVCTNKKVVPGINDLATTNPLLVNEWDYTLNKDIDPFLITRSSIRAVWWVCKLGHSWKASIASRNKGNNCPYCSNKKIIIGYNDLATTHPEIITEWDNSQNELKPTEVTCGSIREIWWKCKNNHSWKARISDRATGSTCPYCQSKRLVIGLNDLLSQKPLIAKEWDYKKNYPLKPDQVRPYTNKKVWWICRFGHSWEANIRRRSAGDKCPYCSHHRVIKGETDLLTWMPSTAIEWDFEKNKNLSPEDFTRYSDQLVYWKCEKGHSYKMKIKNKFNDSPCPICKKEMAPIEDNNLLTTNPELILEWNYEKNHPLKPQDLSCGSGLKVWWRCKENHSWEARIFSRSQGSQCPYCSGRKAIVGKNDLKTCYPFIAEEWDYEKNYPLLPQNFKPRSHKKVWWKCKCSHSWKTTINSRIIGGQCPICRRLL